MTLSCCGKKASWGLYTEHWSFKAIHEGDCPFFTMCLRLSDDEMKQLWVDYLLEKCCQVRDCENRFGFFQTHGEVFSAGYRRTAILMEFVHELDVRILGVLNSANFMRYNIMFDDEKVGVPPEREPFQSIKNRAALGKFCTLCINPHCVEFADCFIRNHYTATQNAHPESDFIGRTTYMDPFTKFENQLLDELEMDNEDYDLECSEELGSEDSFSTVNSDDRGSSLGSFIDNN